MLNYSMRLHQRMDKIGFEPTDPFYLTVKKAKESVYSLSIDLHLPELYLWGGKLTA